jgi:hypothetical protein
MIVGCYKMNCRKWVLIHVPYKLPILLLVGEVATESLFPSLGRKDKEGNDIVIVPTSNFHTK